MPDFRAVFPEDAMKNCVFKAIILTGNADLVVFDNAGTDLNAHNVNDAIVELNDKIEHATDDYYTKEETDEKLALKADESELANYYTKSESDSLLAEKADASSVYTKGETDDLLALKADADSVYTKQEADGLLDLKADESELANFYTKTESDNLLDAKADSSSVYTKQETDNLLSGKVDSSTLATDYYDKSDVNSLLSAKANADAVYTKEETDAEITALIDDAHVANNKAWSSEKISKAIYDILPTAEASGSIANFNTSLVLPLIDVKSEIKAVETGTGAKSPSNPYVISGFTGANISHSDADTSNPTVYTVSWQTEAGEVFGGYYDFTTGKLVATHKQVDLGDFSYEKTAADIFYYDDDNIFRGGYDKIILCTDYTYYNKAYNNMPDNSIAHWSTNSKRIAIRDDSKTALTKTEFKEAMVGVKAVYELATPVEYDLTPQQISALLGVNNIWNDTNGDTTVKYKLSIEEYVAKITASMIAYNNTASGLNATNVQNAIDEISISGNRSLNTSLLRNFEDMREDISLPLSEEVEREEMREPERDDSQR